MIEDVTDLPDGIVGLRASGTVSREDYETTVAPLVERAARSRDRLRVLCVLDEGFAGVAPEAIGEDVRLGLRAVRLMAGCAVVTDDERLRTACRIAGALLPYPLRAYPGARRDEAVSWLGGLPVSGFAVEMRPDDAVAAVHLDRPLRAEDVETLGAEIDRWLTTHADLSGLVLVAPVFPGWDSLRALRRHAGFVLRNHRRIERVAVVADGLLPALAPPVAGTLLHPRVRHFRFGEEAAAMAWAGARRTTTARA
jgi:hypothetical protein